MIGIAIGIEIGFGDYTFDPDSDRLFQCPLLAFWVDNWAMDCNLIMSCQQLNKHNERNKLNLHPQSLQPISLTWPLGPWFI